jgi:hypothetical protein
MTKGVAKPFWEVEVKHLVHTAICDLETTPEIRESGACLRRVSGDWLSLPANYVNRGGCVGSIIGKTVSKHNSSKTPLALRCLLMAILSKHRNRKTSLVGFAAGVASPKCSAPRAP